MQEITKLLYQQPIWKFRKTIPLDCPVNYLNDIILFKKDK